MKSWIQTFTKKNFDPFHPDPQLIVIEDIAHALAYQNRFGGHGKRFYSIAQHSLLVSALSAFDDELYGLLHDASEAYLGDIPRPLKQTDAFAGYRRAEKHLQGVIMAHFGLPFHQMDTVKYADQMALKLECHWLMSPMTQDLHEQMELDKETLEDWHEYSLPMDSREAEEKFLETFVKLMRSHSTTEEVQ